MKLLRYYQFGLMVLLCLVLHTLSGCWNYRELEQLGVVAGAGFDALKEPGKVKLTIQVIKPGEIKSSGGGGSGGGGGGGTGQPVYISESSGNSVFEAIRDALSKTSKRMYWPHTQIIIIGEEKARQGVRPILDFFVRDPEMRPTILVLVAQGKAGDLLKIPGELEKISAMEINQLIQAQTSTSKAPSVMVQDFVSRLMSKTTGPIATRIKVANKQGKKTFELDGTAVFKKDVLVGWLSRNETRGLLWVLGEAKSGIIEVEAPKGQGKATLEMIRSRSKVKTEVKNGRVKIIVWIDSQSNLANQTSEKNIADPESLKSLARRQTAVIRNEVEAALKKAREYNSDIFGFGEVIHREHPKEWRKIESEWDRLFPMIAVEFKIKANVGRVGLINKPIIPQ